MHAMFRNTINISPPTRGWGQTPEANDKGKADDIERIRIYRNKISHENSSDMTTNDFNKSALDLIWVILNIILQRHDSLSIFYMNWLIIGHFSEHNDYNEFKNPNKH